MLRAVHQLVDRGPKILEDHVILDLLPDGVETYICEQLNRYQHPGARALRTHVLLRNRYAEDCLRDACNRGITQYLLLGAGLDTFAYRQPQWASGLRIFELDYPASQDHKKKLLAQADIPVPGNLSFVPGDLEKVSLPDALAASSFDFSKPAFLSWLGVMPYLSPPVNRAIIRQVAKMSRGTEMVFTFSRRDHPGRPSMLASLAAAHGEPWRTRLSREELEGQLMDAGFSRFGFLEPGEARRRYFGDPASDLQPPSRASIVRVIV